MAATTKNEMAMSTAMVDDIAAKMKNLTLTKAQARSLHRVVDSCLRVSDSTTKQRKNQRNHCSTCRELGILTPGRTKLTHGLEGSGH